MKQLKRKFIRQHASLLLSFFLIATAASIFTNGPINTVSASAEEPMLHQYTMYQWQTALTAQQYADYTDAFQIPFDSSSTIINQILSIEPNFISIIYRNVARIASSDSRSEWNDFVNNNWILKDQNGNYIYETRFRYNYADIGNPNCQQWIADWAYQQIMKKNAKGIFCDGGFNCYASELWEFASNPPINPRTGTYWTDQQLRDAYVGLYNQIRAKLGSNRLIVVNGIWTGSRWLSRSSQYKDILDRTSIDGIMGEGWWREFNPSSPWYTESRWKSSVDALADLDNYFINGNPSKMFVAGCYIEPGDASLPPGASATQVARYGYASTLLGIQSNRNYLFITTDRNRLQDYYNRYFSLNVGEPLSDYSIIPGTHVYQRTYSNALVLVNPTNTAYNVYLDQEYTNLNGAAVSGTYTVTAQTGEVLTPKSNTPPPSPPPPSPPPPSQQYELTVELTGGKGWTLPSYGEYTYDAGSVVTVTAYDNPGYYFSYWLVDGNNYGSSNPLHLTMDSDHVLRAMYSTTPEPPPSPAPTDWWDTSWGYRLGITIDHSKVGSDLSDFPLLVDITDPTLPTKTQSNGQDIVFVDENNQKLAHQIESYSSNGHLVAWVKIPFLSSSVDTTIKMYYGNSACGDQQSSASVWDASYLMVQHLSQSTLYDSTANGKDGSVYGSVAVAEGKIGSGLYFTGGYAALPQVCTSETRFTFSAWIYPTSGARYFISQWNDNEGAFLQVAGDSVLQFYVGGSYVQQSVSLNQWHFVVGTFDGTTTRLYVDGGAPKSATVSRSMWPTQGLYVGDRFDHQRQFLGLIDEVRISSVARSDSWIAAEFSNQNSPETFCYLGSEETLFA
jgi:hypothetical protein